MKKTQSALSVMVSVIALTAANDLLERRRVKILGKKDHACDC